MQFSAPLSDLCTLIADCPHSTPKWTNEGVIVLRSNNIRNGRLSLQNASYTDEQTYQSRVRRAKPTVGDIVITREAPMGELCMVPPKLKCCLGQRMVLLRPDQARVVPKFLLYALQSSPVQNVIQGHEGTGSTVSNLRIPALESLSIPLLPKTQQNEAAELLGTLDDQIDSLRSCNETMEAIARAIFKSWFVDFDPVRAKAEGREPEGMDAATAALFPSEFQESDFGIIPRSWQRRKLGQVADVNWGDTNTTKSSYLSEGYPAYSASGQDGLMGEYMFDRTGVVVSAIGANCGATWLARGKWSCIKNTLRFWATEPELSTEFLYHSTRGKQVWPKRGSAQPFIAQGDARMMPVLIPSNGLAATFGDVVRTLYDKIEISTRQIHILNDVRDTLLPRLISGKLRVDSISTEPKEP